MSASVAAVMFGRVAVHNKLITAEQWNEVLALHTKTGGQLPVDQIVLQKGLLSANHVAAINRKIAEHLAKSGQGAAVATAPAPAPAAPPPPAPAPAPKPAAADDGAIPFSEDEDEAAASRPTRDAVEDEDEDGANAPTTDGRRMAAGQTGAAAAAAAAMAAATPTPPPAPTPPAPTSAPAAAGGSPAVQVADRVPSPVKPGQIDPDAYRLLREGIEMGASDVHFAAGSPPFYRVNGALQMTKLPPLTPEQSLRYALGFMDDAQQQQFLKTKDIDFSYDDKNLGRFRVNALEQFRGNDIIFRCIPRQAPTLEQLGMPSSLARFTEYHMGLLLVTGPAGCGKSTTAAALVNLINSTRKDHIITVEDPIEFIHVSKGCNVTQRQVPSHTKSFASALKAALREDPDIIMIGDMRDLETVSLAIRAAETGHLVIGTLSTKNAPRTIDRIVDVFPADQQAQIRVMLSESLRGIISQVLVPTTDGKGRIPALEIMCMTGAMSNLIRDSKTFQVHSTMEAARKAGHVLMDQSLIELVKSGRVAKEEALKVCQDPKRILREVKA
jgi:twitching motility protein PilT